MDDVQLLERLSTLTGLADIPREELAWLVAHGRYEVREAGTVMAPMGKRIPDLWVVLSGKIVVHVDRGVGPRMVMAWGEGEVSGILPYSRMTGPPGHNVIEERAELLLVDESHFPEMISHCPKFTALTVHLMLDRARNFSASDLHDEKMVSLGRLSAGLAHELNNPASATMRGAKLLLDSLEEADAAARSLGAAGLTAETYEAIERARLAARERSGGAVLSPIEQADREDEIAAWLERHGSDPAHAGPLAGTAVTIDTLEALAAAATGEQLDAVLRWFAAGCTTRALAVDIERAATRISELVSVVRKFTYMDHLSAPESVDVEAGLKDTIRMLASKAKAKSASIQLDIEPDLPRASANGGELNQVWINLLDNALDAIPEGGKVQVVARADVGRVVVAVIDDGPGIPADVMPHVFDPFFTTKAPGEGTGLGLEIARRLVRRYRGNITVESRPSRTEFRVNLLAESPTAAAKPPDEKTRET